MNTIEINRTKENTKEKTYSVGQMFLLTEDSEVYILAKVEDDMVCLIDIKSGVRFNGAVEVESITNVTEKELDMFSSYFFSSFTPVDTKITVTL